MKILPFLTILLILNSCNQSREQVFLKFDEIDGLNTGTIAYINGMEVGQVTEIELLTNYQIVASMEIDPNLQLPKDSEITINSDILGNKSISILPGTSNVFLNPGDTINVEQHKEDLEEHPIGNIINSFANFAKKVDSLNLSKQDSLLIELRRLNNNLERLTEKK